jgi:hypothetical protein
LVVAEDRDILGVESDNASGVDYWSNATKGVLEAWDNMRW